MQYKVYRNKLRIVHLIAFKKAQSDIEKIANEHAQDGWELKFVVPNLAGMVTFLIFEKKIDKKQFKQFARTAIFFANF